MINTLDWVLKNLVVKCIVFAFWLCILIFLSAFLGFEVLVSTDIAGPPIHIPLKIFHKVSLHCLLGFLYQIDWAYSLIIKLLVKVTEFVILPWT